MESNFSHGFPNFPFSLFTKHQDSLSLSLSLSLFIPSFFLQPTTQTNHILCKTAINLNVFGLLI